MGIKKWLIKNTACLNGRAVAVTGSTGGLGKELCRHLASLGAELILLNRSKERTESQISELRAEFPDVKARFVPLDLEDIVSVRAAVAELKKVPPDILIHNAGAYSIPRHECYCGYDNVFCINFASPYYMTRELLPVLRERGGRVVTVGSIAHNYSKTDRGDEDFSTRGRASLVYGNAKRRLMYAMGELFRDEGEASLSVTHPGISFTNITAHYPKVIFALIKRPMKVIFMRPKKASLCILKGVFEPTARCEWIRPRLFNVWGYPEKRSLKTADEDEIAYIRESSEKMYEKMKNL